MTAREQWEARLAGLAAWGTLGEADRQAFAADAAKARARGEDLTPAEWLLQVRLGEAPPWVGLIDEVERATMPAVIEGNLAWIQSRRQKLAPLQRRLAAIEGSYADREEAADLAKQIEAETRELDRLEALEPLELDRAMRAHARDPRRQQEIADRSREFIFGKSEPNQRQQAEPLSPEQDAAEEQRQAAYERSKGVL